ncbi:MAG: DUF1501 domain-containing protein [Myxococcales bacterium]|nr:DUF1501 domain-containing protein [Myxococcales bacterium]
MDPLGPNDFGLGAAVALRLLQAGSPVVSLTFPGFDSHSGEVLDPRPGGRPQTAQVVLLARTLSGLAFALQRTADPKAPGRTLWDSTVVFVCSEFGRGGGAIGENGFNTPNGQNHGGSDHDPWSGWPVMGGPVRAGGRLLSDGSGGGFFQQNRVFTSIMKAMGVEERSSSYLPFGTFPPIPGLFAGGG